MHCKTFNLRVMGKLFQHCFLHMVWPKQQSSKSFQKLRNENPDRYMFIVALFYSVMTMKIINQQLIVYQELFLSSSSFNRTGLLFLTRLRAKFVVNMTKSPNISTS